MPLMMLKSSKNDIYIENKELALYLYIHWKMIYLFQHTLSSSID